MQAQALSRGSGAFGGARRRSNSGRLGSGSLEEGAQKPKQMHLELELVAIGMGLHFVELEEGRKVQPLHMSQACSSCLVCGVGYLLGVSKPHCADSCLQQHAASMGLRHSPVAGTYC